MNKEGAKEEKDGEGENNIDKGGSNQCPAMFVFTQKQISLPVRSNRKRRYFPFVFLFTPRTVGFSDPWDRDSHEP